MEYGITEGLLLASISIFIFGFLISTRLTSVPASLTISFIKVAIPFTYFGFFFDESNLLIDSVTYFDQGNVLLGGRYNPISFFFVEGALEELQVMSGGPHILYGWLSYLSQWLFGAYHFSIVFINVGLTFVAGYFIYKLAKLCDFGRRYASALYIFFCLHWEILTWSSLVSIKDLLILTLSVIFIYAVVLCINKRSVWGAIFAVLALIVFYWVRFYVPLLIVFSFFLYTTGSIFVKGRLIVVAGLAAIGSCYVFYLGQDRIIQTLSLLNIDSSVVVGFVRMILTPLPWSIDPTYDFLFLSSLIHWLFLLPCLVGLIYLWSFSRTLKVLIVYLAVALVLYGAFEELQGPRHRIQLIFIYGWAQFHFLWMCLNRFDIKWAKNEDNSHNHRP